MKRFWILLLCVSVLFIALTACTPDEAQDDDSVSTTGTVEAEPVPENTTNGETTNGETTDTQPIVSESDTSTTESDAVTDGETTDEVTASPETEEETEVTTEAVNYGTKVGDVCYSYDLIRYGSSNGFRIEETRGKVTILNFWATWCPPCVEELFQEFPLVIETYGDDVAIVAAHVISVSEDVQAYVDKYFKDSGIIFCQDLPDATGSYTYYDLAGGNGYVPYTLILDENGVILKTITGGTTLEALRPIIDVALED